MTKAPTDLDLSNFLCFAVYSANSAIGRAYKPILDRLGLTYPQYLAMVTLWKKDGQTVGEIGEQLLLETSTLTPLLKRLEAAGLVKRTRDTQDERVVRISLTEEGRSLKAQAKAVPTEIAAIMAASNVQIEELRAALVTLRDGIKEQIVT
ncbi:MarR family transcriptional regulator [Microvirga sp. BSC39]|uniref:MarR family winged helix-turn-helix transcriptional regulator n=1 Tax=Microvirga sp. BSC39 TaxID=1549810 RepID=UPI0004E8DE36|nr:MarR family transcriptional regulator [Microvirga sp. BSC39]KFG66483.1 MarR family transcriptional regulator [Microvirga sp. BSC39]